MHAQQLEHRDAVAPGKLELGSLPPARFLSGWVARFEVDDRRALAQGRSLNGRLLVLLEAREIVLQSAGAFTAARTLAPRDPHERFAIEPARPANHA
jgi:hypothetical protein